MHQREHCIVTDKQFTSMFDDYGKSNREMEPKISNFRARTATRVRVVLVVAVIFLAVMLVFQLCASTRQTNILMETLYMSNTSTVSKSDLRILIIGLIFSLQQMNDDVTASLAHVCSLYKEVEIHIVYGENSEEDVSYRQGLEQAGCSISLVAQQDLLRSTDNEFETMNRFQRLALLRSLQRQQILQRQEEKSVFDAVVNIDLDVTDFAPLYSLLHATEHAANKNNNIFCANGYETWYLPWGRTRLYYDTLAAIDANGTWWYNAYATNLWQILTFGQARLFHALLKSQSTHVMQSCFGGLAVYDYSTWSTEGCDYSIRAMDTWQLSTDYMLSGGDACEHVVFQQCLRHALPRLNVGIQPDLLIGRDAALFSTREAKVGLVKIVSLLVVVSFGCIKAWRRRKVYRHKDTARVKATL